jgi:signal transduction histidine kinase
MKWIILTIITLVIIGLFYLDYQLLQKKEAQISTNLEQAEQKLEYLPKESLNFMPWTLGYRSPAIKHKDLEIELKIEFKEKSTIDSLILLPATYTVDSHQLMAFGFPKRFYITDLKGENILIDYRTQDYPAPGIEPQVFNLNKPFTCQGIRFITKELVPDATWWSDHFNFSLSEIYAFSNEQNVALHSTVLASHHSTFSYIWNPNNLVDGFSLFSPVIRKSIHPLKFTFMPKTTHCNLLYINEDLEELDEVRLWPVIHSLQHNYPPSSGLGFPQKIKISCSDNINFSSNVILYQNLNPLPKPGSNPLCLPLPKSSKKYYLFELSDPLIDHRSQTRRISLAEIEWLNHGKSVSSGNWQKYPKGSYEHIEYLNDGYSNEGKILPLKESLLGLNLRAKLEKDLIKLKEELYFIDGQKNEKIRNLFFAGLCIIIILSLIILMIKFYSQKKWHELRESIAADLHDEVGANLSSIGQYNELLKQSCFSALNEQQIQLFDRAIQTTRETSQQTRHLIQYLEQRDQQDCLSSEIKKICQNLLPSTSYNLQLTEAKTLDQLKATYKWHFTMFIKEALNNIKKHAQAKHVTIQFTTKDQQWVLEIIDDGIGFNPNITPPLHLKSRAQKLNAELDVFSQPDSGTQLQLIFRRKHFS